MSRIFKGALILFASAGFVLAESWTGKLIDANCSAASGNSSNSSSSKLPESCMPTSSTKVFAIQTPDGKIYRLDSEGNTKAAEAMKSNPGKSEVTVSGNLKGQMVNVESLQVQ